MEPTSADIVFVTNIPTPYRTAFFNVLSDACIERGRRLAVLYCARTEPRRDWDFHRAENQYPYAFLPGVAPTVRNITLPVNLTINARLAALSPKIVVHAGAWVMPTNIVSLFGSRRDTATRLFWSEGHADAVRNSSGPIAAFRHKVLGRFDGFVVPNRKSAAWLSHEGAGNRPVHFLPNTVDEAFYTLDRSTRDVRAAARAALGIAAHERVVVQVAALVPRKGPVELAQAFARLPEQMRATARLVFVGDGELRGQVEAIGTTLGNDRITVTGNIKREGVRSWLAAANAFALNTRVDPNPLSPIEASFAGLPLLLSRRAGNFDEMVGSLGTGFAIDDCSHPDAALEALFSRPADQLENLGRAAQSNATLHFTRGAIVSALLDSLRL